MTHPFHPLLGREYDLIQYRHFWGEDRVVYLDETGEARSLPARWTSAVADDPTVVISAGRSHFRVADLVELVGLVRGAAGCGAAATTSRETPPAALAVKEILPHA